MGEIIGEEISCPGCWAHQSEYDFHCRKCDARAYGNWLIILCSETWIGRYNRCDKCEG